MLSQIKREQKKDSILHESAHLFEVDSFAWRFDILALRANLRTYCIGERLWTPPSQANSTMVSSDDPFNNIQKNNILSPAALNAALVKVESKHSEK